MIQVNSVSSLTCLSLLITHLSTFTSFNSPHLCEARALGAQVRGSGSSGFSRGSAAVSPLALIKQPRARVCKSCSQDKTHCG